MECTAGKKRKIKRTFLTTFKKSKRYRQRLYSPQTNTDPNLSDYSTSSILTENDNEFTLPPSQCPAKKYADKSFQHTYPTKNQTTHCKPSVKNVSTGVRIHSTSTATQTLEKKCKTKNTQANEPLRESNTLIQQLCKNGILDSFTQKLAENNQLDKFVLCIKSLASGLMSFMNLAWKSFLDMGTLFSLKSTTTMEYNAEWLEFCQVLYHMFGTGVMNALRGRGHFSHVTSKRTDKGKYDPQLGEFNFPIPSTPMLKKLNIGFPSEIPVGIVQESLDIAHKKATTGAEFILSFDGKLIAPGCKGDSKGDCNMWGIEGPPNLRDSLKILNKTLNCAKKIDIDMNDNQDISLHFNYLKELLNTSSRRIKKLRGRITGAFYLRKKLIEKCGDNQELQYKHRWRMSSLNQNTAECETVIRSLLEMNLHCSEIMAILNANSDVHIHQNTRHIVLSEHANNFQLLPPEVVQLSTDLNKEENYQLIKQCSDKWFEIRKLARITGSTLYSGLGFDTLAKQKEHHYQYIRGRKPPPTPPELQKFFDHGTRNEVNAISTLISTAVPAYLPACYAFYEVGPSFVHSNLRPFILEVSADGLLQCSDGTVNCPNYHIHCDRRILVEIKSPVPKENIAETLHYEVPNRYMFQLQAEMKAYSCEEVWYVCSTAPSETITIVYFNEELWNTIWQMVIDLYDKDTPNLPTKLHPLIKPTKLMIAESKRRCCKFLCELPTVTGERIFFLLITILNSSHQSSS